MVAPIRQIQNALGEVTKQHLGGSAHKIFGKNISIKYMERHSMYVDRKTYYGQDVTVSPSSFIELM